MTRGMQLCCENIIAKTAKTNHALAHHPSVFLRRLGSPACVMTRSCNCLATALVAYPPSACAKPPPKSPDPTCHLRASRDRTCTPPCGILDCLDPIDPSGRLIIHTPVTSSAPYHRPRSKAPPPFRTPRPRRRRHPTVELFAAAAAGIHSAGWADGSHPCRRL